MTYLQKQDILRYYNAAVDAMRREEPLMDAARSADEYSDHSSQHSFALGRQAGIAEGLDLLGYRLEIDDEDYAVDIKKED